MAVPRACANLSAEGLLNTHSRRTTKTVGRSAMMRWQRKEHDEKKMFAAALVEQLCHTARILTFCVNYRLAPVAAPYFMMWRLTVEGRRV
jgi:hypothetical protein